MDQFKQWWESISEREQRLTSVSVIAIAIAILYWGIWTPLTNQLAESQQQLNRAQATLTWTQDNANALLKMGSGAATKSQGSLTQNLNNSARQHNITFSRIVNRREQVEVLIANVEFEVFLKWLTVLSNKHGISVVSADLTKTNKLGYIKVNRLLLSY